MRMSRGAVAGVMMCTVPLAGLAGAAPASGATRAPVAAALSWHRYHVPVTGQATLDSVVALGRDDAWAGGFTITQGAGRSPVRSLIRPSARARPAARDSGCVNVGFLDSLMLHWDGRRWRRVPVPDLSRITQISAPDPADAWAVADCGLLRWNGRRWAPVTFPVPPGAQQAAPNAIEADRPDDVWLLGTTYSSVTGHQGAFLDHWNGQGWQRRPLPHLGDLYTLDAIDAHGPSDVWAAGTDYTGDDQTPARPEHLILLHWNGRSWTRAAEPSTGMSTRRVTGLKILSARDVWMAGWGKFTPDITALRHPLALHWNGTRWSSAPVPAGKGEVYQIAQDAHRLWAVGDTFSPTQSSYTMSFLRWSGRRWVNAPVPVAGEGTLFSAAPAASRGLWAVGATSPGNAPVIGLWN